jgi:cytochrome b561
VLGLVLLRILWRATHRPPAMPGSFGALERFAAHAAHGALYVLMVLLPLSGWMHDSAWKDAGTHPDVPLRPVRMAAHRLDHRPSSPR